MNLLEKAQAFEGLTDAELAAKTQAGGDDPGDTLLLATETQRRKDVRDRYQAQLEKHQAQQQAQQGPDDIVSQRVRELTERGGGITGVDPGMPLEDPRLQQGIATPPDVQALQRAYGGLIPGYSHGGEHPTATERLALRNLEEQKRKEQAALPFLMRDQPELTDEEIREQGRSTLRTEWLQLGQSRPENFGEYLAMSEEERSQLVPRHETVERPDLYSGKTTAEDIRRFAQDQGITPDEAYAAFYSDSFMGTKAPAHIRAEFDPQEGGQAQGQETPYRTDEFGRQIGPDGKPVANVGVEDDYEYDNRKELLAMFSRAKAKFDETGDPIYQQEMESIAAGLENLTSGPTAMKRRAEQSGLTLEDFIASMEQSEGDKTRAHQMGLLERGLGEVQRVEDLFTTRTDADKAHREAAGRAEDAILADARGIHSLKEGQMGELEDYRQRRQGTVDTIDEDLRELREYQREVGRLGADAAFMHVGTGVGDEWRGVVANKLDAQRTENLSNELSMLTKLHANMKEGDTFEGLDQQAIYDLALEKQNELDTAEQDRTDFDVQNLYEDANRKRDIAKDLIDERMGLFGHGIREEGANQRAARAAQADMVRAQLASKTQGENFLANPENWPHIELMYDEVIERLDPITHGDRIEELKKELEMVSEYMTGLQTQTAVTGGLPTTRETGSRSLTFSGLPQDLSILQMAPRSAQ